MLGRKIVNIEFNPDAWRKRLKPELILDAWTKKSKTRTHSRCLDEKE